MRKIYTLGKPMLRKGTASERIHCSRKQRLCRKDTEATWCVRKGSLGSLEKGRNEMRYKKPALMTPFLKVKVLSLAIEVENLPGACAEGLQVGKPQLLTALEMNAVKEGFVDYKNSWQVIMLCY
jgi:hypothetical protein